MWSPAARELQEQDAKNTHSLFLVLEDEDARGMDKGFFGPVAFYSLYTMFQGDKSEHYRAIHPSHLPYLPYHNPKPLIILSGNQGFKN